MQIRPPRDRIEHRSALACLIQRQGEADPLIEKRIDLLESYARKRGLSLDHCLVAAEHEGIEAVLLCLDSPGRTSSILLSSSITLPRLRGCAARLFEECEKAAAARGVQLLQGMVAPECSQESLVYAAVGFEYLATLIYMQRDLAGPLPGSPRRLDWVTYDRETHPLFARVVQATYENSLDCGSLNGVRDIEDILASHRATGLFDPACWFVGLSEGEPVGVLLLGFMEEQQGYEVVYMGCLPGHRGGGCGSSLLAHGLEVARARGASSMSLSVDEKNEPARGLYGKFGFREITHRDVWIRIISG